MKPAARTLAGGVFAVVGALLACAPSAVPVDAVELRATTSGGTRSLLCARTPLLTGATLRKRATVDSGLALVVETELDGARVRRDGSDEILFTVSPAALASRAEYVGGFSVRSNSGINYTIEVGTDCGVPDAGSRF
jgi:hypothetical protein